MDYKKYLPKVLVGLVFFIILIMFVDVKANDALPSLLGFLIGGAMIVFLIKKLSERKHK